MIAPPNELTDPPASAAGDAVDEILAAMHLSGGVVIQSDFRGRWAIISHFAPELCCQFFPITGAMIGYHYVREGSLWASVDGVEPLFAPAGSIIVLPRNDPHRLYTAELEPVPAADLLDVGEIPGLLRINHGTEGEQTRLFCGFLSTSEPETPLLDRLPPLMVIEPTDAQGAWVGSSLGLASAGVALPPADVGRLTELLVRATLRDHLRAVAEEQHGWLDGLRDRHVARCLALIHRHFADELDMAWLSREVGLSRSALHERFVSILGEPPMRYCTRWRLRRAAALLRETAGNTASIAHAVGYGSEAAFNRAFKREFGKPPAAWRRRKGETVRAGPAGAASIAPLN